MSIEIREADKVQIHTLQDNYIDLVARDNNEIIERAMPLKGMEIRNSVLAEHGFSSLITISLGEETRTILFDFGFSEHAAAYNAEALNLDLTDVEIMALSHGHLDHVGGLEKLSAGVDKKGVQLVLHPTAFRTPRFSKISDDFRLSFPSFTRQKAESAGVSLEETAEPRLMVDGAALFLGEIPRRTDFERVPPNFVYDEDGVEKPDAIEDDSALVFKLKGKGLVVLSGCAHSGIINTLNYAREVTGTEKIHAVMGGFHLSGTDPETVVAPTTQGLKAIDPDYIVPTHCTGRDAIMTIEKEMPDKFILNMSGTKLTFTA
ncbi:MAG: MBL fold metallo-hydrolase [Proteobacteria bacterium]|nr:MBL fold metallo-hydrolase [Pseudomonadota bacterium]